MRAKKLASSKVKKEKKENRLEDGLSPEAKALLKEIDHIRKAIGPVKFKIADLLREVSQEENEK